MRDVNDAAYVRFRDGEGPSDETGGGYIPEGGFPKLRDGMKPSELIARLYEQKSALLAALKDAYDNAHDCQEAGEDFAEECPRRTAAMALIAEVEK